MTGRAQTRATVTVAARPLWRVRFGREAPRWLVQALAVAGLLASARYAIAPPRPLTARAPVPSVRVDRAAEGFAALFARAYLTWDARDPEAHRLALQPYLGAQMEAEAGFEPPQAGEQQVLWTQVVQSRAASPEGELYTVAAQTDASGLLYLSVPVARTQSGSLALAGYPAFVGPPATAASLPAPRLREVEDPSLTTVVTRALRNYLARAESELAADLTTGARVSPPAQPLALEGLASLDWSSGGRSAIALVHARDPHGGRYALAYELEVRAPAGRWEVASIQMDPSE